MWLLWWEGHNFPTEQHYFLRPVVVRWFVVLLGSMSERLRMPCVIRGRDSASVNNSGSQNSRPRRLQTFSKEEEMLHRVCVCGRMCEHTSVAGEAAAVNMSDISAKPDHCRKLRHNREDGGEWKEAEVEIYQSVADVAEDQTRSQPPQPGPDAQNRPPVHRTSLRAAVCLGALCLLLLVGTVVLSVRHVSVTLENEQLQIRSNNYSELLDEVKKLKHQINEAKFCPGGWKTFGSSCYLKSFEEKSWSESRKDCQNRGSDLVVISSREEQDFVISLSVNEQFWIGLKGEWNQTESKYQWTWVDGSALTQTFSSTGHIEECSSWCYAVHCDGDGRWTGGFYTTTRNWMCEKPMDIVT